MAGPTSKTAKAAMGDKGEAGKRMYNGQVVKPVLYAGRQIGHGKYMSGEVGGKLVCGADGRPLLLRDIGDVR